MKRRRAGEEPRRCEVPARDLGWPQRLMGGERALRGEPAEHWPRGCPADGCSPMECEVGRLLVNLALQIAAAMRSTG